MDVPASASWLRLGRASRAIPRPRRVAMRLLLASLGVAMSVGGCSRDEPVEPDASSSPATRDSPVLAAPAVPDPEATARAEDPRPSVVLLVVDTLRADAVSAYGQVEGTTPTIDGLARDGVLYRQVFAPSPWTLSSHVSLFSGQRADEHGVGLSGRSQAPSSLRMLAEDFRDAGYETAGFSENTVVSPSFGLDQGFETFVAADVNLAFEAELEGGDPGQVLDVLDHVRRWNRERDRSRPYFLFINVLDPHDPYILRDENPWVPQDAAPSEVEYASRAYRIAGAICDALPPDPHLRILRGLYLGDVAAADAKVDRILDELRKVAPDERRLVVLTSDHGEHLGEHRLMQHRFSVRTPVLRVPLVVTGLPDVEPGVVDAAVAMRGIRASLLCWALDEDCPGALPLPGHAPAGSGDVLSFYSDLNAEPAEHVMAELADELERIGIVPGSDPSRSKCAPDAPVFGEMVSLIRYPMKLNWVQGHAPMLYDLSWDPMERSDQSELRPEVAVEMWSVVEPLTRARLADRAATTDRQLTEEETRALKSLGYIE